MTNSLPETFPDLTQSETSIKFIIDKFEKPVFTNRRGDRGGPTKYGVTQKALSRYLGREATIADVRNMTLETAVAIFKKDYWTPMRCANLPAPIRYVAFDMCVNHGQQTATKLIQRALQNLGRRFAGGDDGIIGPETISACYSGIDAFGSQAVLKEIIKQRRRFYSQIVADHPEERVNFRGWMNRAQWFEDNLESLANLT